MPGKTTLQILRVIEDPERDEVFLDGNFHHPTLGVIPMGRWIDPNELRTFKNQKAEKQALATVAKGILEKHEATAISRKEAEIAWLKEQEELGDQKEGMEP